MYFKVIQIVSVLIHYPYTYTKLYYLYAAINHTRLCKWMINTEKRQTITPLRLLRVTSCKQAINSNFCNNKTTHITRDEQMQLK